MGTMEYRFLRCISITKICSSRMVDRNKKERTSEIGTENVLGTKGDTILGYPRRLIRFQCTSALYAAHVFYPPIYRRLPTFLVENPGQWWTSILWGNEWYRWDKESRIHSDEKSIINLHWCNVPIEYNVYYNTVLLNNGIIWDCAFCLCPWNWNSIASRSFLFAVNIYLLLYYYDNCIKIVTPTSKIITYF